MSCGGGGAANNNNNNRCRLPRRRIRATIGVRGVHHARHRRFVPRHLHDAALSANDRSRTRAPKGSCVFGQVELSRSIAALRTVAGAHGLRVVRTGPLKHSAALGQALVIRKRAYLIAKNVRTTRVFSSGAGTVFRPKTSLCDRERYAAYARIRLLPLYSNNPGRSNRTMRPGRTF